MLDMSWGEVMVIGGVALIVIGPKDLPKALRTVGQMTAKVRRLAGEFQSQFNEAMREADLDDVRRDLENINREVAASTATTFNPIQTIRDELKGAVGDPMASGSTSGTTSTAATSESLSAPASDSAVQDMTALPVAEEIGVPPVIVAAPAPEEPAEAAVQPEIEITGPGLEPAPLAVETRAEPLAREGEPV